MELKGKLTVEVESLQKVQQLCLRHIPGYDAERFEPVALRVFAADEFIVTVYAAERNSNHAVRELKFPVKKFKLQTMDWQEIYAIVQAFNFTLTTGIIPLEDMDVVNR